MMTVYDGDRAGAMGPGPDWQLPSVSSGGNNGRPIMPHEASPVRVRLECAVIYVNLPVCAGSGAAIWLRAPGHGRHAARDRYDTVQYDRID